MSDNASQIVFYRLSTKFVDNEREIPEESQEVMYYTLSVGHHTGVIDCFSEVLRCSKEVYTSVLELLDDLGEEYHAAFYKLDGINRRGEIQVDKSHLAILVPAIQALLAKQDDASDGGTSAGLEDTPTGQAVHTPTCHPGHSEGSCPTPAPRDSVDSRLNETEGSDKVVAKDARTWIEEFKKSLDIMRQEPSVYLMGREVRP